MVSSASSATAVVSWRMMKKDGFHVWEPAARGFLGGRGATKLKALTREEVPDTEPK